MDCGLHAAPHVLGRATGGWKEKRVAEACPTLDQRSVTGSCGEHLRRTVLPAATGQREACLEQCRPRNSLRLKRMSQRKRGVDRRGTIEGAVSEEMVEKFWNNLKFPTLTTISFSYFLCSCSTVSV